jgi:3-deoxy-D-manno-octulosonic-acid transferase
MSGPRRPLSLAAYGLATALAEPLAPWLLRRRAARGKEDLARLGERLGRTAVPRPDGPLVWLHGASVGESLSLLPLIERLREERPRTTLLVTSGTVTSAELLARRLPKGVLHQFSPVDAPGAVRRFLAHWRPNLAIFAESELWPNLILAAKASGAKLALVSAKVSEESLKGWRRFPRAIQTVLACYDLILAQDNRSVDRLAELGRRADGDADLKYGALPLPCDDDGLSAFRGQLGRRTVLLAASTHPGEDEVVLDAFASCGEADEALLIIAPRHPERGPEIAALAHRKGLHAALRSEGEMAAMARVYVADTLGELGMWYRLARVAFVGGSFVPGVGGHNPLEPARLGCPVLFGPLVDNWRSAYDDLLEIRAADLVEGGPELSAAFDRTPNALNAMAARATERVAARDDEARVGLARILDLAP